MKRVLLIEDDPHNATVFRRVLERRAGVVVEHTEDVARVLEAVRAGDAQLVILDVALGNSRWQGEPINGVGICRLLQADPATARVPVLLATAHAMRGDAERLLAESGANGYVAKPIVDHEAFAREVARLIQEAA